MIFDHYLCVFHWSPEFAAPNARIQKMIVWVRFPGLNLLYYDESVLLGLASVVGRPIKVDQNTLRVERGRFARVCVEIDLSKPVVGKFWLKDHWYRIEYEGLHPICSKCGCYGHLSRNCPNQCSSATTLVIVTPLAESPTPETIPVPTPLNLTTVVVSYPKDQQGLQSSFDLDKDVHGEWLTVSRRKKASKVQPKKDAHFEGLRQSIDHANQALAMASGTGLHLGDKMGSKQGAKQKRRRQETLTSASQDTAFLARHCLPGAGKTHSSKR